MTVICLSVSPFCGQTPVCVAHGTPIVSPAATKPQELNDICGEMRGRDTQGEEMGGREFGLGQPRWKGRRPDALPPLPVHTCGGRGPPGSPIMSTASPSLEQFFGPLISVALGHWGREVPGPLVGLRAQSVPSLTLALAFLGHGQGQMSPDSCCFLGLTSSGDSTFPSQEPHCPEVLS